MESKPVGESDMTQQKELWYRFTLKENTEFQAQFKQEWMTIRPASLNGFPINLAIEHIVKIKKVNDPGWMVSRKLKYFVFELQDGSHIAGLPNCKSFLVNTTFSGACKIEIENILLIEKVQ